MCDTRGDSLGKNVQEISSALPCQNSLSDFICTGSTLGLSFRLTKNLNSVETQKYETARKLIFSIIESLASSISILEEE